MAFWTANKVAYLKARWGTCSASEIGRVLRVSRNAVIGKAHRLGLPAKEPCGRKLTPKDVRQIRRWRCSSSFSVAEIALIYGVSSQTIWRVDRRRSYKHIA